MNKVNNFYNCIHNMIKGGLSLKQPQFEQLYIAIITFFPFFYVDIFDTNLLLIVCALR